MSEPTKEELLRWWYSLQGALDKAGTKIDLTEKSDRCLLTMISYDDPLPGAQLADVPNAREELPLVDGAKIGKPGFDPFKEKIDDVVESAIIGDPSEELLRKMFNKAKEGLLFTRCKNGFSDSLPRQILVGIDGKAYLGEDIEHMTGVKDALTKDFMVTVPKKPQSPGVVAHILAFFRVKKYKDKVDRYNRDLDKYNRGVAARKAADRRIEIADPQIKLEATNLIRANASFFSDWNNDKFEDFVHFQEKLSSYNAFKLLKKKISSVEDELTLNLNPGKKDNAAKEALAKLVCLNLIEKQYKKQAEEGHFEVGRDTLKLINDLGPNCKSLNKLAGEMMNNESFIKRFDDFTDFGVTIAFMDKGQTFINAVIQEEAFKFEGDLGNPEQENVINTDVKANNAPENNPAENIQVVNAM